MAGIGLMVCSAFAIYFAPSWGERVTRARGKGGEYSAVKDDEGSEQGLLQKVDRM